MQVVVHQHKSVQIDLLMLAMLDQQFQKGLPVCVVFENRLPVVATQDDMVRVTGQCESGQSGHVRMVMRADALSGVRVTVIM